MPCYRAHRCDGTHRRGFLLGAGATLAALGGADLIAPARASKPATASDGMPGPFPGKVVEVHHPGSVRDDHTIAHAAVRQMVARGMCELTGAEHAGEAW